MTDLSVRTQIYLERDQHQTLKQMAAAGQVSMAHLIREAVTLYLAQDKGMTTEEFDQEVYLNDPIWQLPKLGEQFGGTGWHDAAENHDHYIYDLDKPV